MAELPLDDVHRNTLAGQLDGVSVAELMRGEPAAHAGVGGKSAQLGAGRGRCPWLAAGGSVDHAEQRPDRHLDAMSEPRVEVFEPPLVHPDLRRLCPLP